MKSPVYFIAVEKSDNLQIIKSKFARLVSQSKLLDCIKKGDQTAVKIHFGEEGNTGYVRPQYLRVITDSLKKQQANPFLSDTNTLYRGGRTKAAAHLKLAYEHGFRPEVVGAPVVIAQDTKKEDIAHIAINQKFVKLAKIAALFHQADAIVDVSHFKGHMLTGFGGALKNLAMGCATREGKLEQHCGISPIIDRQGCVGCGACAEVCPVKAITIKKEKAHLDTSKCIGCASCIAACPQEAIDVDWSAGEQTIQKKMVEYALAVLRGKEKKCVCFNFVLKVTKECDCLAKDDPRIAPDIGILASADPVSVDKASYDLVNQACGRDIFREAHPKRDPNIQLVYAAKLGLGNLDYKLIEL